MTKLSKEQQILEISAKILELKKLGPSVTSKKTIQKLQQQLTKITNGSQN